MDRVREFKDDMYAEWLYTTSLWTGMIPNIFSHDSLLIITHQYYCISIIFINHMTSLEN